MRKFATDAPEMFAFALEGHEGTLTIPRMASLPVSLSARFADIALIEDETEKNNAAYRLEVDILAKYLPADVLDVIDSKMLGEIFTAYMEESNGENPGE